MAPGQRDPRANSSDRGTGKFNQAVLELLLAP
jgi:hypothetical protein